MTGMATTAQPPVRRVRVWDAPTRLFHWLLVIGMTGAVASAHWDGYYAMRAHFLFGYAVLALVAFRIGWGFAGPHYARFTQFVRGPAVTLRYARALFTDQRASDAPGYPGHNPLGALSVLALLAACGVQSATGLFSRDDIASEGPLARFVSGAIEDRLTHLHDRGETALYALLALHLLAIAFYRWVKHEDLLRPMIHGDKTVPAGVVVPAAAARGAWPRAALLLALCVALVCAVANVG